MNSEYVDSPIFIMENGQVLHAHVIGLRYFRILRDTETQPESKVDKASVTN